MHLGNVWKRRFSSITTKHINKIYKHVFRVVEQFMTKTKTQNIILQRACRQFMGVSLSQTTKKRQQHLNGVGVR